MLLGVEKSNWLLSTLVFVGVINVAGIPFFAWFDCKRVCRCAFPFLSRRAEWVSFIFDVDDHVFLTLTWL